MRAAGDRAAEAFTEDLPKALHDLLKGLQSVVAGKIGDILFGIAAQVAPGHATVGFLFFEFEMQIKEQIPSCGSGSPTRRPAATACATCCAIWSATARSSSGPPRRSHSTSPWIPGSR